MILFLYLKNPWNPCSDWSPSNVCVWYESLAPSQSPGSHCLILTTQTLLDSELTLLPEMDFHPISPGCMILAKLFNLCEPKNYVGRIINTKTVENMLDNLQESLKKTVTIIIFFLVSSVSWWLFGCLLPAHQVGACKLSGTVSLAAWPDDLLLVGPLSVVSLLQGCGSSLDSVPDSGVSWSERLILFLTLWFPDLEHLEGRLWGRGIEPRFGVHPGSLTP